MTRSGQASLLSLFFAWGAMSVLVKMTVPYFKTAFALSYRDAMLIQSAFFVTYLVLARVTGSVTGRIGFQRGAVLGLVLMAAGAAGLALATLVGTFAALLPSVFVIASGVTFLQVAANPLAAISGATRSAASNLTLAQGFNSLGTVVAPLVAAGAFLGITQEAYEAPLTPIRDVFFAAALILLLLAWAARHTLGSAEAAMATGGPAGSPLDAARTRRLIGGTIAIFLYVGAEVSISSVLVNFLEAEGTLAVSRAKSASLVAVFWGGMLVGRFVGAPILARLPRRHVLAGVATIAALLSLAGLALSGVAAGICVLAIGLFSAIQFPTIFAIASSDLEPAARARAAGWLCTGIVGGAVIPLIFGMVADAGTLQRAMIVPALCYAGIALFAWAYGGDRPAAPVVGIADPA